MGGTSLHISDYLYCLLFVPYRIETVAGAHSDRRIVFVVAHAHQSARNGAWPNGANLVCACLSLCVCMVFHGDLERSKPDKQGGTGFYLTIASGGAAGSILAGLISPMVFKTTFEFSIVVLAALYYVVATGPGFNSKRVLRVFVIAALVLAYASHETSLDGQTIARERSFYGTYAVRDVDGVRRLVAGTYVHGEQFLDEAKERIPIAYYHKETGVGMLFELIPVSRVALVGLGVGSLVEYGNASTQFDIFELDGAVVRLAPEYFSVLSDTPSQKTYVIGDGRLGLQRSAGNYDLIVMDAFASGSIPTHLVTVEAIEEAFHKLAEQGAIAHHISNQNVDLLPVLSAIAAELNVAIRIHESISNDAMYMYPARWFVLTRSS